MAGCPSIQSTSQLQSSDNCIKPWKRFSLNGILPSASSFFHLRSDLASFTPAVTETAHRLATQCVPHLCRELTANASKDIAGRYRCLIGHLMYRKGIGVGLGLSCLVVEGLAREVDLRDGCWIEIRIGSLMMD